MLTQLAALLAPVAADLPTVALDQAVSALLDANSEIARELDRIDAKVEAIRTSHAREAYKYLEQALEAERTPASKLDRIRKALAAFERAEANSPADARGRSVALVNQAVCWYCLGSPADVRRRLEEAVVHAFEALYELAISYNRPGSRPDGRSRLNRYRPGIGDLEHADELSLFKRAWESGLSSPISRLQHKMQPEIESANTWATFVTDLAARSHADDAMRGSPSSRLVNDLGGVALLVELSRGESLTLRGIRITFCDQAQDTHDGTPCVDVNVSLDFSRYAERERQSGRTPRPWLIVDPEPWSYSRFDERVIGSHVVSGEFSRVLQPLQPGESRQWLKADPSASRRGIEVAPGQLLTVSGWRCFRQAEPLKRVRVAPNDGLVPRALQLRVRPEILVTLRTRQHGHT